MARIKTKLYQIFDNVLQSEKFCFSAKSDSIARELFYGWLQRHSLFAVKQNYTLSQVTSPDYIDNIHNEYL